MDKRIFGYDVVRTIAILLVMVGHVLGYLYSGTYSFFLSFLSGFFGVELFFVLSGVLIGGLLIKVFNSENYPQKLKNFLYRRWLRTLPLYFVMLLVYWLGNLYFDSVQNHDVSLWKYFFFIQNFFHVQPTFFGISWSLSIEEWFYVLFPLSLFCIKKFNPKISTKKLFTFSIILFLIFFLSARYLAYPNDHFNFYEGARKIAFLRLDAIVFGILAAFGFGYFGDKILRKKYLLFAIGLCLLLLNQYFIFKDNYSNLHYFNTLYYSVLGLGLVMIFPFFKELNSQNRILKSTITFVSKISYSLYLIHWLVYKFLELNYFSGIPNSVKFFLFFGLSFLVAFFTYRFIELPFMNFRKRFD